MSSAGLAGRVVGPLLDAIDAFGGVERQARAGLLRQDLVLRHAGCEVDQCYHTLEFFSASNMR